MTKLIALLLTFAALLAFSSSAAQAQQTNATLTGIITDPNNAVIQGATVSATNKGTNFERTVTTNSEGVYVISSLPVGNYVVKVKFSGFMSGNDLVNLSVGQTVNLDKTIYPSGTIDFVDVENTSIVDTQTSKVDAVVDSKTIENLPLNGRNFLELALLTPGNAPAPNFDPTKSNTVLISSAGQLGRGANVMIDGTDNNDDVVGGSLINISQDAVAEFQVATNRFSAEYGRSGSSVINVVTKSGTNALRGSASFFERDRRLQGLPATFDRRNPTPPFDRQQYSFTLGGPIVKDKLFWFGAAEYRDQNGAVLVGIRNVAARTITQGFAPAPLKDLLLNGRIDYKPSENNQLGFRYSFENIKATDSSKLDRSIGSASYRQQLKNQFHAFSANWNRTISSRTINNFAFSINNLVVSHNLCWRKLL